MIITLTGANDFAIRHALDTLVARYLSKHGAHAIERIDGETLDAMRLPDLLQGVSLFASERLVILRDAAKNKPLWEALGNWAERVSPEIMLAIIEPAPDKRTRTYKQLQKHGELRDFAELNESQLATWAVQEAKNLGAALDARTAHYLVHQVGTNQWRLSTELQKLAGYNANITAKSIDELVVPSPQASAFELLDAVLAGKSAHARELLLRLKASEDPYKLFGLLVSQIQTLALVVTAQSKPADVIAKEGGIHPFVVRKMQPLTRHIDYVQLQAIIEAVAKIDTQMKSTGADPWVLLEQCLGKIAAQARG
jgi:DNA polymerase-3 subunit delta